MSSIKPPDGRGSTGAGPFAPAAAPADGPAAADAPDAATPGGAAPAGADFREALNRAQAGQVGQAAQAGQAASAAQASQAGQSAQSAQASHTTDPLAELAGLVRSGALTSQQALDRLVERALGQVARGLSDAQRAELAGVLRTALESDPALQALRADAGIGEQRR